MLRMSAPKDSRAWINSYMGHKIFPLGHGPDEAPFGTIDIRDIAHQLSQTCRFRGACKPSYTVAEHSVRIAMVLLGRGRERSVCLAGLLHDATEAYLADVPSPVKYLPEMRAYRELEQRLNAEIMAAFDVPWPLPPEVEDLDRKILPYEALCTLPNRHPDWPLGNREVPEWEGVKFGWKPEFAEEKFLATARRLGLIP